MPAHGRVSPYTHPTTHNDTMNNQQGDDVQLNLFEDPLAARDLDADDFEDDEEQEEDDFGMRSLFADLPSTLDQTRSLHDAVSRRSLRRRQSSKQNNNTLDVELTASGTLKAEDVAEIIDAEDGNRKIMKSLAAPMAQRKSVRRIHEHRRQSQRDIRSKLPFWKAFKLQTAMTWTIFKIKTKEFFLSLHLWRGSLKEIEGNFGNGVLSYFIFLKSLLVLNVLIFLFCFSFLVVPQIVIDYGHLININSTVGVAECPAIDKSKFYQNFSAATHILDFFTGQGYINTTLMFYSNYHGRIVIDDKNNEYNMPLAYMLVGGAYFIISLLVMVTNLAQGFTESIIDSGGFFYSYCNKVFASWDYCITSEKAVALKCNCIQKDFVAELAEEERLEKIKSRTSLDRFKIYVIRVGITIVIMALLAGAIYAIIRAVEVSTDQSLTTAQSNSFVTTLKRWASSLTISALNVLLPFVFELLTSFEDWSPRVEVAMALWRAVLLKLASVAVLVITLYSTYGTDHACDQCWENQMAGQMFNLIFIDFFVIVGITIFAETGRKYVYRYFNCGCEIGKKIGMQEFQIPKNVLDLVYGQSLIWIGAFFAPLLPVLGILKLFILFYVKKISLIYNCKPSTTPYQGARSNYFFTLLLLLTFLLCTVAVGWGVTKLPTSYCGPYCNVNCNSDKQMIDIIQTTIESWPAIIENIVNFLKTSVFIFPLFIIIFLVLYYYHAMTKAHEKMISMLKDQLIMEGRDKRFLMDRLVRANHEKKRLNSPKRPVTEETVISK